MRGACLVHFTLEKPELDFVAAALPHLSVHDGLYKDQPPANCMTEGEVTQMRNDLTKKVKHFPDCGKRHLRRQASALIGTRMPTADTAPTSP